MLGRQHHRGHVDPHHPFPLILGFLDHRAAAGDDADIVVEHVEPPEALERRGDHRRAVSIPGDVCREPRRRAAAVFDHRDRAFRRRFVAVDHENLCARPGEQDRRGPAIADAVVERAAAGNQGNLAGKAGIVGLVRHTRFSLSCTHVSRGRATMRAGAPSEPATLIAGTMTSTRCLRKAARLVTCSAIRVPPPNST